MSRKRIRYGPHHSQVADLWRPTPGVGQPPVLVLIHGGFWRAAYTKVLMNGLAASAIQHGWAAWNIEYRRVGLLGGGGGWPVTFHDVATAIDHLDELPGVDTDQVVAIGHSAGGHLALWAAARPRLDADRPGGPVKVPVRAAVSLAGIVDLLEANLLGLGDDATAKLLGGGPDQCADRYRLASPAALLPLGIPQVLVHGLADQVVPPSMSQHYQERATAAGDPACYLPIPGAGHRDLIEPEGPGWLATVDALKDLIT